MLVLETSLVVTFHQRYVHIIFSICTYITPSIPNYMPLFRFSEKEQPLTLWLLLCAGFKLYDTFSFSLLQKNKKDVLHSETL